MLKRRGNKNQEDAGDENFFVLTSSHRLFLVLAAEIWDGWPHSESCRHQDPNPKAPKSICWCSKVPKFVYFQQDCPNSSHLLPVFSTAYRYLPYINCQGSEGPFIISALAERWKEVCKRLILHPFCIWSSNGGNFLQFSNSRHEELVICCHLLFQNSSDHMRPSLCPRKTTRFSCHLLFYVTPLRPVL